MTSSNNSKLLFLKWLHTVIWVFYASIIFYILIAGILDIINNYVYISIALVFVEFIVLLIFKWRCPITIVAEKYTDDRNDAFDIFLPQFIARHNKTIFSIIFIVGLVLVLFRSLNRW